MYSRLWVINREEVTGLPHHLPVSTLGERKKNTRQRMCVCVCVQQAAAQEIKRKNHHAILYLHRAHTHLHVVEKCVKG